MEQRVEGRYFELLSLAFKPQLPSLSLSSLYKRTASVPEYVLLRRLACKSFLLLWSYSISTVRNLQSSSDQFLTRTVLDPTSELALGSYLSLISNFIVLYCDDGGRFRKHTFRWLIFRRIVLVLMSSQPTRVGSMLSLGANLLELGRHVPEKAISRSDVRRRAAYSLEMKSNLFSGSIE